MPAQPSRHRLHQLRWLTAAALWIGASGAHAATIDQLLLKEDDAGATALADDQVRRADAGAAAHGAELASALEQRAWVAFIAGDIANPSVADDLNRALALREADADPKVLVKALALQALRALTLGQKDQCRDLLTRALAIADAAARDRALALSVHGGYAALTADYPAAQRDFESANRILADAAGADSLLLSRNLVVLSFVRHRLDDDPGAFVDARLAIKTVAVQPGPRSRAYARALSQLGAIETFSGEYKSARRELELALAISREQTSTKAGQSLAQLLQNLGNLCLLAGDYEASRDYYGEALAVLQGIPGVDPQSVFVTSSNLGEVENASGNFAVAIARLESALAIGIKALGENNERLAGTYINLADAQLSAGAVEVARTHYAHALQLRRGGLGEDRPLLAAPIEGLGKIHLKLLEFDAARIEFEHALAIRSRLGAEHRDTAGALLGLAQAHWGMGDTQAAFDLALRAERVRLAELRRNAPALSEREGIAFSAQAYSALPLLLQLTRILDTDNARNRTWTMVMAERGLITDAMAWRAAQAHAEHDALLRNDWVIGRKASEESLRIQAPKMDNIHFATHGFAFGGRCSTNSATQRGLDLAPSASNTAVSLHHGQLTGLALAGANRGGVDPEHDGLLTGEEIAALDLHHARWVVLSACDSGLGQVIEGEGVFGLRRGFRIAGARSVIMSLWPVSDAATADWMLALYRARFAQRADTATAMHDTTLAALVARRAGGLSTHPYYWASFVAAGDWR